MSEPSISERFRPHKERIAKANAQWEALRQSRASKSIQNPKSKIQNQNDMTRFPHDQFAKQYLKELLSPLGEVETSCKVSGEVREIDVWFVPASHAQVNPQVLGLLGRFATSPCLIEPFRNAATPMEIRSCLSKLFDVYAELERQANRNNTRLQEIDLPRLWILSPTASVTILDGFRAKLDEENWLQGVYFLGELLKTAIVVIHQLPRTEETLWLRLLGKGRVQKQAIAEVRTLPQEHPLRSNALLLLSNLLANLQNTETLDEEDRELIMELSPLVLQWQEEATQKGIQQGIQQERRTLIENLLKFRFSSVDDELTEIIEPWVELPTEEFTTLVLQLSQLSREELLARFREGD